MSLKMSDHRMNGSHDCGAIVYEAGIKGATEHDLISRWVETELAWSCRIVGLEKNMLRSRTYVMGCVDTTEFTGEGAGMELLHRIVVVDQMLREQRMKMNGEEGKTSDSDILTSELEVVMEFTKGLPALLDMGAGMILGGPRAKQVMIGVLDPQNTDTIDLLAKKSLKELCALACIKYLDKEDQTAYY